MEANDQPRFEFAGEPASLGAARNVVRGFLSANGWADREIDAVERFQPARLNTVVIGDENSHGLPLFAP